MKNTIQTLHFILTLVMIFNSTASFSQNLMIENFDYSSGDPITDHGWTSFSGGTTNPITVTSPGLSFPQYPLSGIGNSITMATNGQDVYKPLSDQIDSTGSENISVYLSFMVNVTSAQTGDYFIAFLPSNSNTFYSGRVHARSSNGNLNFGITKGGASDTSSSIWTSQNFTTDATYLIVLKYMIVSGGNNDIVSLFILDGEVPSSEPVPSVGPLTFASNDPGNIGRVALRQGISNRAPIVSVDGIKVTKTWEQISTDLQISSTSVGNFSLSQNYPNPFNPLTKIKFSIPEQGLVSLRIFNPQGKEIMIPFRRAMTAGNYTYEFNGSGLSSGMYFYSLVYTNRSKVFSDSKKFILLK